MKASKELIIDRQGANQKETITLEELGETLEDVKRDQVDLDNIDCKNVI